MLAIRSLFFYIGYLLLVLLFGLLSLPLFLVPKNIGGRVIAYWNLCTLAWLRVCCGVRVELQGDVTKVPTTSVIVSNHQSPWETFYFQHLFFPVSTVLKKELLRLPLFGWGLRLLEPMAIDRSNPIQALKQIRAASLFYLQRGKKILLFPEGTRISGGELGSYKRGAADIAQKAQVPLVPIAHNGGKCWPGKKFIKYPGTIQVVIGEAIDLTGKDTKAEMQAVENWTRQQLVKMNQSGTR